MELVNIEEKLSQFEECWRPKVVARLNGQEVKVVKIDGEFPWHSHAEADEMFMGWRGRFRMEFRDRSVEVGPGELIVVPRGVEHRPVAPDGAEIMLFEPADTLNTGDAEASEFTAPMGVGV